MNDQLMVPNLARRFVGWIGSHPWLSVGLGLVLAAALGTGLPKIRANFTHTGFFYAEDPLMKDFAAFERRFGNDDAVAIAMHSPSGIFDQASMETLRKLTEKLWLVPEVIRVDTLANFNWVHADGDDILVEPFIPDRGAISDELLREREVLAQRHEVLPNYLISKDSKTTLAFAHIKPGLDHPPDAPAIVNAVRDLTRELSGSDHVFHISGGPAITLGFQEAAEQDFQTLVPVVLLLIVVVLWITLRSFIPVLLSLLIVALSVVGALGIAGWAGVEVTNVTSVLPQILIAIGIADAVHILVTFLRTRARGIERKEAATYTLLKNFQPTVFTSLTTALGFFSFVTADLKPIAGLGLLAGTGAIAAWFFTYLVLGGLLFVLPIRTRLLPEADHIVAEERARRYTAWLHRRRPMVLGGFYGLCLLALGLATQNTVNSNPFEYFYPGFWIRVANEFIEEKIGGARPLELMVDAKTPEAIKEPEFLKKVEVLQEWIEDQDGISRVVSIIDILRQTNRALNGGAQEAYRLPEDKKLVGQEMFLYTMSLPQGMDLNDRMTVQNDALRVTAMMTIPTSNEVMAMIGRINEKASELGLSVVATGKQRLYMSMNGYVVKSFIVSVTSAVVLISLVLVFFFRSFSLGMIAMLPNAVPLIVGGGVLFLIGRPLDIGSVLVLSVCLGIAVDDTIHVMANFRRLRGEGKSSDEAVADVLAHTGPALIVTTSILVISFGAFAFATFTPNLYFGVLTAVVLTIALATDLTFLPALLLSRRKAEARKPEAMTEESA